MREHFHVPENYFLSHSVGCLPKEAPDQLRQAYFEPWAQRGGDAWPDWLDLIDQFRAQLGALLGSPGRNICPQTNVSSGLTKLLYALPDRKDRRTIVCSEQDFPTIGFVLKQAERMGYQVRFVTGDVTNADTWAKAWDDSVGLVHITHAFSNTSKLAPVAELCALARERAAISVVDIAQSVGAIPVRLDLWKPDFALGTGVKFLCCGPGACFLYASDEMIESCAPLDVGWFSHEQPFEMDIHDFRYADSAMRFFGGTPSPAPFILAVAALHLWKTFGSVRVQKRIQDQLDRLCALVPDEMLVTPRDRESRGGTFVIDPRDRDRFRDVTSAAKIQGDERKEGFRFSVHGYTDEREVDMLIDALTQVGAA